MASSGVLRRHIILLAVPLDLEDGDASPGDERFLADRARRYRSDMNTSLAKWIPGNLNMEKI